MPDSDGPLGRRRAGVLLHVTSLPDGRLGSSAYEFVDFLAAAGCTVWQVLPLTAPHADGSPYSALSVMASNPALIDPSRVPDDAVGFETWCRRHAGWLEPYVEFVTLSERYAAPWWEWPAGVRDRDSDALAQALADRSDRLAELRREQWIVDQQWQSLREYAATRGVLFFGDLPIFVSLNSADVWASRELFELDPEGRPTTVTGVPPDYFAADGQLWGNPHYDWDRMTADGFAWWRQRIVRQRELFDIVRIDHFRGFAAAWHVPAGDDHARNGWWVPGPGSAILAALVEAAGPGRLVAEDLGIITEDVERLRRDFGLPGMRVLQFGFDGSADNPHLPANHDANSVVYTGTHDNDTTMGWWDALDERTREHVRTILVEPDEPMPWALIRSAFASPARLAVVPGQDLLGLGSETRMNTPSTTTGNWRWRAEPGVFTDTIADRVRSLAETYDR